MVLHLVRRSPRTADIDRSRWRLADLLAQVPGWRLHTPQGLGRVLARLGLSHKRGRSHIHSPDPDYVGTLAAVRRAQQAAQEEPTQVVLFLDEMTLYRQPTIAPAWEARGQAHPLAQRSQRADTPIRILGALDASTGQVQMRRADRCSLDQVIPFLGQVAAAYPGHHLTVVLDTWPVHVPPDVLGALEPQTSAFPLLGAANWSPVPSPQAQRRWGDWALPIQLVQLPSYAPWTNPIEKVWRTLRQDLGHLHPYADDLPTLRARIDAWFAPYQQPSPDLLRYVGLMPK